jgi:transcription antitermination factor NusG
MLKENEPHWFVMRIRNSSIARLQTMLERLDKEDDVAETYAPLGFIKVSKTKIDFAPFLLNYIFVRSDFQKLVKVKSNQQLFEPLRFVMHPVSDENFVRHVEPLFLSDKSMHDYMRMTKEENDRIVFLNNMQFANKVSKEVQITEGEFAGVIGRIKRIKGLRCVVLPIGSEMAAAVVDVPNKYLRYLTDEEVRKIEEQEKQDRKKINT